MNKIDENIEIYFSKNLSSSLTYSANKIKVKEVSEDEGFGIRVKKNSRVGFSFCSNQNQIREAIEMAKTVAKFSPKTNFNFTPEQKTETWNNYDKKIDPQKIEQIKDQIDSALSIIEGKTNPRIIVSNSISQTKIENGLGYFGDYKSTVFSAYIEFMIGSGSGFSYFSSIKKPKNLIKEAQEAYEIAKKMGKARKLKRNGEMKVVFTPSALENLIEILIPSFSGDWFRRKITKINKNKLMFDQRLTLADDPLRKNAISSRPFDDEGSTSTRKELIGSGIIKNFLFDKETAALAKLDEQGNASRSGYDSRPAISQTNLVIEEGQTKDFDEIGEHIEIISAHGSHTSNPTSGDFGLEVNAAIHKNKGDEIPVRGFLISGNVFECFREIEAIGKEQMQFGTLFSPKIAFKKIKVIS